MALITADNIQQFINEHNIVFHSDPGHGWLEVPRKFLLELDIADKITGYSYENGFSVFLEEDQDLTTFLIAATEDNRRVYIDFFTACPDEYKENTPVRNYNHYSN